MTSAKLAKLGYFPTISSKTAIPLAHISSAFLIVLAYHPQQFCHIFTLSCLLDQCWPSFLATSSLPSMSESTMVYNQTDPHVIRGLLTGCYKLCLFSIPPGLPNPPHPCKATSQTGLS